MDSLTLIIGLYLIINNRINIIKSNSKGHRSINYGFLFVKSMIFW